MTRDKLVDASWHTWEQRGGGRYQRVGPAARQLLSPAHLQRHVGPVRTVSQCSSADTERVLHLLEHAGDRAAGSTLAALHTLVYQRLGHLADHDPHPLSAGQRLAEETARALALAHGLGARLAQRPNRVDAHAVAELTDILERWTCGPLLLVPVAAELPRLFGVHADRAQGWPRVADRWLQPNPNPVADAVDTVTEAGAYLLARATVARTWFLRAAEDRIEDLVAARATAS